MKNLTEIPKKEALFLTSEAIIGELDNLIKSLDLEIIKLKGIKKEILSLQ